MIRRLGDVFVLDNPNTSYVLGLLPTGHVEHMYYGERIQIDTEEEAVALREKFVCTPGNTVYYNDENKHLTLENICLEMSSGGKGDILRFQANELP